MSARRSLRPLKSAVLLFVAALAAFTRSTHAAEVTAQISATETYVGVPVTLSIRIINAEEFDAPAFEESEGLRITRLPGTNTVTRTNIANGRMTSLTTETLTYSVTALSPGDHTMPAATVRADGRTFSLPTFSIRVDPVSRSAVIDRDTGETNPPDTVFAEVVVEPEAGYVGQSLKATLNLFIQPYEDKASRVSLGMEDMFQFVDLRRSTLGVFEGWMETLRGKTVEREDTRGNVATYFQYTIDGRIWLDEPHERTIEAVTFQLDYPLLVVRQRSFFEDRFTARRRQSLVIGTEAQHIEVKSLPAQGRPEYFTGAVGKYDLNVTAKPTDVTVGEPMTLTIDVIDQTPGGSRLELLQAPSLDAIEMLNADFKVPSEAIAGTVNGRIKTFQQTVRATSDRVQTVPSIPFSFFDPDAERYVTVHSDPIEINVASTGSVSLADVIGAEDIAEPGTTTLTERAGILANYTGESLLLADQELRISWRIWLLFAAPPGLLLIAAAHQARARRLKSDAGLARRRGARGRAAARLKAAASIPQPEQANEVASAVASFACDHFDLPQGSTRPEICEHMTKAGIAFSTIDELNDLLATCEQITFAGDTVSDDNTLVTHARQCIDTLERVKP